MNLLEDVNKVVRSDSSGWIGRAVGDTPDATDRAASVGVPAVLGGLAVLGGTTAGATTIVNLVRTGGYDEPDALTRVVAMGSTPDRLPVLGDQGKGMLGTVFGPRLEGVIDSLSASTQISRATIIRVLTMLAPIALAVLGRRIREGNLDANGVSSLLRDQHASLVGRLPGSLAASIGLTGLASHAYGKAAAEPVRREAYRAPVRAEKGRTYWPWVALAVAGALAFFLFMSRRGEPGPDDRRSGITAPSVTPRIPNVPAPPAPVIGRPTIPPVLTPPMPPHAQPQPAAPPAPEPRAALDPAALDTSDIHFDVASSELPANAPPSLDRVAGALRENPDVQIRVTGYTDATGPNRNNERLSMHRAEAVRAALVDRGVNPNRIEVEAAAAARPVATNDTDEGRSENRRVEVQLVNDQND